MTRFLNDMGSNLTPGDLAYFLFTSIKKGMRLSSMTYAASTIIQSIVVPSKFRKGFLQDRFYLFIERLHLDIFCHIYKSRPADLVLYYFPGSDTIEHLFFGRFDLTRLKTLPQQKPGGWVMLSPKRIAK